MTIPPGLLVNWSDPQAVMAENERRKAAALGSGPDPIAITPQMAPAPAPPPMALKPMAEVPSAEAVKTLGSGNGMTDAQRMALSKQAAAMGAGAGTGGVGGIAQGVANAAVPLLDAWQQRRAAKGQGSILSGLLGK